MSTSTPIHGAAQIGHVIRRVREERGWDQAELALRADVHRSYVSKVENAMPADTLTRVMRMLRALDLEMVIQLRSPGDDG
jgi:HTH-type transcriptional regulator / antitoxin HipB